MSRFSELRNELNREIVKDEKERDQDQINKLDEELRTLYEAITTAPEMVAYNQAKAELESALNFISQIVSGSANGQDPDLIEQQVSAVVPALPAAAATDGGCSPRQAGDFRCAGALRLQRKVLLSCKAYLPPFSG